MITISILSLSLIGISWVLLGLFSLLMLGFLDDGMEELAKPSEKYQIRYRIKGKSMFYVSCLSALCIGVGPIAFIVVSIILAYWVLVFFSRKEN